MTGAKVCAVCSRPLNLHFDGGWVHAAPEDDDHPAVPVEPTDIPPTLRCDICYREPVVARLPVAVIEIGPGHLSDPFWALCAPCRRLVHAGRWNDLTRNAARAITGHLDRLHRHQPDLFDTGPPNLVTVTATLGPLLARVRENVTGPLEPI